MSHDRFEYHQFKCARPVLHLPEKPKSRISVIKLFRLFALAVILTVVLLEAGKAGWL